MFLDMGVYHLQAFPELGEAAPGSPALQGLQIMQMLLGRLSSRAQFFGPLAGVQVSSSRRPEFRLRKIQACMLQMSPRLHQM